MNTLGRRRKKKSTPKRGVFLQKNFSWKCHLLMKAQDLCEKKKSISLLRALRAKDSFREKNNRTFLRRIKILVKIVYDCETWMIQTVSIFIMFYTLSSLDAMFMWLKLLWQKSSATNNLRPSNRALCTPWLIYREASSHAASSLDLFKAHRARGRPRVFRV